MFDLIAFDWDGTIADTKNNAFSIVEDIAALFKLPARVSNMADYRRVFQEMEDSHLAAVNHEVLRELHRILMGARAGSAPLFTPVLQLARRLTVPATIVTAGLRSTVLNRLGEQAGNITVLGHENGTKVENLLRCSRGRRTLYVCDNRRDVECCRQCGIESVGVAWGYEQRDDLARAGPTWLVADPAELESLLDDLELLRIDRCSKKTK